MKRDMDLCRKILLKIEEDESGQPIDDLEIEGYSTEEIMSHCELLYQVGFIQKYKRYIYNNFSVQSLTWAGYDFLDKIREETIWNKIKSVIAQEGLPLVFDVIKNVATNILSSGIGG